MTTRVRTANAGDQGACMSLLNELIGETSDALSDSYASVFESLLSQERGQVLVAEAAGGGLLGMASMSYNLSMRCGGEYCQLEELIVAPSARGQNIGGLLMEAFLETARNRGCHECGVYLVETTGHNKPFYEKYGFRTVGDEMRQSLVR